MFLSVFNKKYKMINGEKYYYYKNAIERVNCTYDYDKSIEDMPYISQKNLSWVKVDCNYAPDISQSSILLIDNNVFTLSGKVKFYVGSIAYELRDCDINKEMLLSKRYFLMNGELSERQVT